MLHGAPGGFGLLGAGRLERLELGLGRAQAALLAHSRQAVVQIGIAQLLAIGWTHFINDVSVCGFGEI
jgi:hypothetical protein